MSNEDKALPMMDNDEVFYIDSLIQMKAPDNVLEWGSGDSTIYFTQNHADVIERWDAIEDHPDWHEHVKVHTKDFVNVQFLSEKEYYAEPLKSHIKYDLIIADGKYRNACMVTAKQILADGGDVLLHDSCRSHYGASLELFDNKEVITNGNKAKSEYLEAGYNGLMRFWDNNGN